MLALSVLDDVDVDPSERGWRVVAPDVIVTVTHREVAYAVDGLDPDGDEAVAAVRRWVAWRRCCARDTGVSITARARPVGLPRGHALHPGPDWVVTEVLGGALDLGLGIRGTPDDPEAVGVVDPVLVASCGGHAGAMARHAQRYLIDMAALAAERFHRDPIAPLRPLGDCDVLTLLASDVFRAAVVAVDPFGMRTAAIPMRTRGWLDLGRIDPAFALAAAAATDPAERGFERPVMLTRDEVVLARAGTGTVSFGLLDRLSHDRRGPDRELRA
jgi:hypothetical protein